MAQDERAATTGTGPGLVGRHRLGEAPTTCGTALRPTYSSNPRENPRRLDLCVRGAGGAANAHPWPIDVRIGIRRAKVPGSGVHSGPPVSTKVTRQLAPPRSPARISAPATCADGAPTPASASRGFNAVNPTMTDRAITQRAWAPRWRAWIARFARRPSRIRGRCCRPG